MILVSGVLVNWSGLIAHGFWWTDESRHAMHGAFFVDFLHDLPLGDPLGYVQHYFAQYPALAFNWYLPFFPAAMGVVMSVVGVSEATAHAVVVATWLSGVVAWFAWLAPRIGRLAAALAGLALLVAPGVLLWSRSLMLEAPAVGMCAVSAYAFQRYLDRPGHATGLTAGLALFTTLLIKQTTVFILPALLVHALTSKLGRQALWRSEAWWGVVPAVLALLIVTGHAIKFGGTGMAAESLHEQAGIAAPLSSLGRWLLYGESIYGTAGAVVAGLAALGLILVLVRRDWTAGRLPMAWLAASYVFLTYLSGVPGNSARYGTYAMPAVAFFAAYPLYGLREWRPVRLAWLVTLAAATLAGVVQALTLQHNYVDGYEAAAGYVSKLPNSGAILFAGKHDGNFVFHLRQLDPRRQRVVLRGDKVLVTMSVHKYFGVQEHVANAAALREMLDRHGVRWIVVESRDLVGLKAFRLLHETLRGPGYRILVRVPVKTNVPEFADLEVLVYENLNLRLPADGRVQIDYPYLGKRYEFRFAEDR